LPFATIAAFPVILFLKIPIVHSYEQILMFASLSILITLVSKMFLFWASLRKQKKCFIRAIRAFIVHMGMTLVYSGAWISYAFQKNFSFERTNKFVLEKKPSLLKNTYSEFFLGSWFLVGAVLSAYYGYAMETIVFLLSASALFSIYFVYWKIVPTKKYSKDILFGLENKYQAFIDKNTGKIRGSG
jgi:hypothetical protein